MDHTEPAADPRLAQGDIGKAPRRTPPDPLRTIETGLILEVIAAYQEENSLLWNELRRVESRVARYDRVFEQMFKEEAEQRLRVGEKDRYNAAEMQIRRSPLQAIRDRLEKFAAEERLAPLFADRAEKAR